MASKPNPIDVHVGRRLRLRRTLLGMSQERLGELLGLTFQQVQKYERGVNRIGSSRLFELGQILDVPVSFFFDDLPDAASALPASQRLRRRRAWPRTAPRFEHDDDGAAARQARDPRAGARLLPDRRPGGAQAPVRAGQGARQPRRRRPQASSA